MRFSLRCPDFDGNPGGEYREPERRSASSRFAHGRDVEIERRLRHRLLLFDRS